MKQEVIQFIGTQRSGSNLLRLMLNQHEEISAPHPPHILQTFMPILPRYGDLSLRRNRYQLVDDVCNWVECNPVKWTNVIFDRDEIVAATSSLLEIFVHLYQLKREADQASIWCCKSTFNIDYTTFLEQRIKPFYIYLYRDGRDVATSFQKAYVGPKHVYHIAQKWHQEQMKVYLFLKTLEATRFISVSYEALTSEPKYTLTAICEKLGVDFDQNMLDYFTSQESVETSQSGKMWANVAKPIIANNTQKYLQLLTAQEIQIFEGIAADSLNNFGYKVHTAIEQVTWTEDDILAFDQINNQKMEETIRNSSVIEQSKRQCQANLLKLILSRDYRI